MIDYHSSKQRYEAATAVKGTTMNSTQRTSEDARHLFDEITRKYRDGVVGDAEYIAVVHLLHRRLVRIEG